MKRIMIVDDEPMDVKRATFILEKNGYYVASAPSGLDCILALGEEEIDLILLDIAMPDMDGFETLNMLKNDPATADIPVVFLTANAERASVMEAGYGGVAGYVKKPFTQEDLIAHIEEALGNA